MAATDAQKEALVKAREAQALKRETTQAAAPVDTSSFFQQMRDMQSEEYSSEAVNEVYQELDSSPVPILSTSQVNDLETQVAELLAEKNKLESKLKKFIDVPRGMALPELADDYVLGEDLSIKGLDMLNHNEVRTRAVGAGHPDWRSSRVRHSTTSEKTAENGYPGGASTYVMYDSGGYARRVPRSSVASAIASGLTPTCPLCNGRHKESETNPNVCPSRPKVAYTICEICRSVAPEPGHSNIRFIWDTNDKPMLDEDGNEIDLGGFGIDTDPNFLTVLPTVFNKEERLRVRLESHIRAFHPATAASMKLPVWDQVAS